MVRILRKLNLWVIFFTLLAYAAPFVRPSLMSLLMFAGLAYPWLLLANLIFISLWGFSRMKYWWWSTGVVLMGFNYFLSVFGVNYLNQNYEYDPTKKLKVMTYNTGGVAFLYLKDKLLANQQFNQFLAQQNPDVFCFQEFYGGDFNEKTIENTKIRFPHLANYPYVVMGKDNSGALFSRFPVLESAILDTKKIINGGLYADIQVNDHTILRFYNFHLASNKVSTIAGRLADKGEVLDDDSWFAFGRMLALVRRKGILREYEANFIKAHAQNSPYPVILCGDFNDIPVSYTYSTLAEGMNDIFAQTGQGFGTTYNGKIPALRIDYILTSPNLKAIDYHIIKNRFSDHFPIVSSIRLKD